MSIDPYKILGVEKTATNDEIKKAYRAKARELHPDQQGGDETKFKEINEAYDLLKDADARAQYDAGGKRAGYGGAGPGHWTQGRYSGNPFNDPYMQARRSGMWGGGPTTNNVQANAGVPLDILIHGGEIRLPIQAPRMVDAGNGFQSFTMDQYMVKFNIEPLTPVGTSVTLMKADHGIPGIDMLVLRLFPETTTDGTFRVEQLDIHVMVMADAFDALFGRQMDIMLPTKEQVRVTLPTGISSGKSMRLTGKGLAGLGHIRGDVYLVISLKLPTLSEEQKHQIQDILYPQQG
jgi:curved DNA-binding protein